MRDRSFQAILTYNHSSVPQNDRATSYNLGTSSTLRHITANKIIASLENEKNLEDSINEYQKLLKLNMLIEKKFQKNSKKISENTKSKIKDILTKNK